MDSQKAAGVLQRQKAGRMWGSNSPLLCSLSRIPKEAPKEASSVPPEAHLSLQPGYPALEASVYPAVSLPQWTVSLKMLSPMRERRGG